MINSSIFLEQVTRAFLDAESAIASVVNKCLDATDFDKPTGIERSQMLEAIKNQLRPYVEAEMPGRVAALKFLARQPLNTFHSAWLSKSLREAERKYDCIVGIRVRGTYIRKAQYGGMEEEIRVVAAGQDPQGAVIYVWEEDKKFDPNMFDSDGYLLDSVPPNRR
jgi:hypothetical protein